MEKGARECKIEKGESRSRLHLIIEKRIHDYFKKSKLDIELPKGNVYKLAGAQIKTGLRTWNKTKQEMFLVKRGVTIFALATQHYLFTVGWNHFLKKKK